MLRMIDLSKQTPGHPAHWCSVRTCLQDTCHQWWSWCTSLEHFHTWRMLGLSFRLRLNLYFVMFTLVSHSLYTLLQKPDILSTKYLFRYFHCHHRPIKVLFFILSAKQPLSFQHFAHWWFLDLLLFSCFSLQQCSLKCW